MQSKIELLLSLRDRMSGALGKARQKLRTDVGAMKRDLTGLKTAHAEMWAGMQLASPMMLNPQMLANPYVLAGAAVVGLGVTLNKAKNQAAAFNHEFLAIRNLNLDKTETQLASISDSILRVYVSRYDRVRRIVAGTFEMSFALGDDTSRITEGRFDLRF